MYADQVIRSMKLAIDEVTRRRKIQLKYNQDHNITPTSISKAVREKLLIREPEESPTDRKKTSKELKKFGWHTLADIDPVSLTPKDKHTVTKELTKLMHTAAKAWDFELAAKYRDMIKKIDA
jgi:excinuclease ABC subunit B